MQFKVAQRYGRALFELAEEKGILETVAGDMQIIESVINQTPEVLLFFSSPIAKEKQLQVLLETAFQPSVHNLTWKFLNILLLHKRLHALKWIPMVFQKLSHDHFGIIEIKLEAVYQLTANEKKQIVRKLEAVTAQKVLLECRVNKHLIGGFNLFIGEKLIDCSIVGKLDRLREKMLAA